LTAQADQLKREQERAKREIKKLLAREKDSMQLREAKNE